MAAYDKTIFEAIFFTESVSKNLFDADTSDQLVFAESSFTQHKIVKATDHLAFRERITKGQTSNLRVSEILIFNQNQVPRIGNRDVFEILVLLEFLNDKIGFDQLALIDIASTEAVRKVLSDQLVFVETTSSLFRHNLPVVDTLFLSEGIVAYLINLDDGATQATYCTQPTALVLGVSTQETPTGSADGVNRVFTLSFTPKGSTLLITVNGAYQFNYVLLGATITFAIAPAFGSILVASYLK